uniref:DUF7107 domain-containing protein n=1 Tax=Trichuris muris TaxID=70415 RepID=A0A5S6QUX7_TRIMR
MCYGDKCVPAKPAGGMCTTDSNCETSSGQACISGICMVPAVTTPAPPVTVAPSLPIPIQQLCVPNNHDIHSRGKNVQVDNGLLYWSSLQIRRLLDASNYLPKPRMMKCLLWSHQAFDARDIPCSTKLAQDRTELFGYADKWAWSAP